MRRSVVVLTLALACFLGLTIEAQAVPWPDHGSINPVTKVVILEYGEALYDSGFVAGFPTDGYAEVNFGSRYEKVTSAERANALLTEKQSRNNTIRLRVPHKDIDASGTLYVRHGLGIGDITRDGSKFNVKGRVVPRSEHSVTVKLQKKFLGVWVTRQSQVVKTAADGDFTAKFSGSYKGTYRVYAAVYGDASNAKKTTTKISY